jgi:general stress protein 26
MGDPQATEQEYAALLGEFKAAILTTRGMDGHFRSRPMAVQQKQHRDAIWFATSASSEKCRDIENESQVSLAFHDGENDATYLSISGQAELVDDRQLIHQLWDPTWRAWFPDGPDQADLVLIKVVPEHVEWVHPKGGRLKVVTTMLKRAVTGSRQEPGEKKQLNLH